MTLRSPAVPIVVSLVVHGVLAVVLIGAGGLDGGGDAAPAGLVWIDLAPSPPQAPSPVAPVGPVAQANVEEPVAVAPSVRPQDRARRQTVTVAPAPAPDAVTEPRQPDAAPIHRRMLSMRSPGARGDRTAPSPERVPSPAQLARVIAERSDSAVVLPRASSGEASDPAEEYPDGYEVRESVFTATVSADGRVRFDDQANFSAQAGRSKAAEHHTTIEKRKTDPYGPTGEMTTGRESGTAEVLSGRFDVTDWAMRAAGQDPYAYRKARFMDRTREQRAGMAMTSQRRAIDAAIAGLGAELAEIWARKEWSPARRRRVLFQRWDECAESGSAEVIAAGEAARAVIIGFIRRVLPRGSEHAYTAAELEAFDRERTSSARFAPYE